MKYTASMGSSASSGTTSGIQQITVASSSRSGRLLSVVDMVVLGRLRRARTCWTVAMNEIELRDALRKHVAKEARRIGWRQLEPSIGFARFDADLHVLLAGEM